MQVLIIEDDNAVRKAYTKALEGAGCRVTAVADGVDAFRRLKKEQFDVLVCDVALPGLEGTTFFQHLSERYPRQANRVLFVTGYAKDANTKKLLEHTGRPYLSKPVDVDKFVIAVTQVADSARGK